MNENFAAFLDGCEEWQFELLRQLVLQPSHSRNKGRVDIVGRMVAESLRGTGMLLEIVGQRDFGDHLLFSSPGCAKYPEAKGVLLFGHMDTVFPDNSAFDYYHDDGEIVSGPGVIDMKGGLVAAIFAIRALAHFGLLEKIPLRFICNSDEEIGSVSSTELFREQSTVSALALGFECGGLHGEVVTGRKGKAGYRLHVRGQAGHAAFAGPDKASAILELAGKIIRLEQLNDAQRQIVVNVGVVGGGIGPNTVADSAFAEIDTRFLTVADAQYLSARIEEIAKSCSVSGTSAELEQTPSRLPMEQAAGNRRLFSIIKGEAVKLGIPCIEELRSGVSDANTLAESGIAVIDGLGPVGASDHSEKEYMIRDSLPQRTKLAANSIMACWQKFCCL